tara:strand:+ start:1724 stop:2311 length:588 start_codon:yes stop_codon:yes gene_type:complete
MGFDFDNLIVTGKKKEYENIKPGLINAICVGVWNIGVQKSEYNEEVKFNEKIIIGFEVEQRNSVSNLQIFHPEVFTMSLHAKSKLGPMIESWFSKKLTDKERYNYDLKKIVGKRCTLNLIENGTWISIATILPAQESNKLESMDVLKGEVPTRVKNSREKAVINENEPQINIDDVKPLEDLAKKPEAENTEKAPF